MKDKVVIITGASSGIGKACTESFAKHGAKVVLCARNKESLDAVVNELKQQGHEALGIVADVSKGEDCKKLIAETIKTYGRIDVLINNAGISMRALFKDLDLDVIRKLMDVNFWGTVYCTKYALPYLLESKGSVVGISSIAGKKGLPGRTGYAASKFAMEGFLETVRIENLKRGVHVLLVSPGFTASNIRRTALSKEGKAQGESPRQEHKMLQPEEVAEAVYHAVLKRKRDLILSAQGKLLIWLDKFFPSLMDKMVYKEMAKEKGSGL